MDIHFHDKIQLQVIVIYHARDVAALNFKNHPSLEYLDLSANEFLFQKKTLFTKEDIRKWIQPNRQLLYTYHLDISTNLEILNDVNRVNLVSENVFHLRDIFICHGVYSIGLETFIVEAIKLHRSNKIEKIINYMNILNLLNFRQHLEATLHFYSNLVPVLIEEQCMNSTIVIEFVHLFNFYWWLLNCENTTILQYILYHAQKLQERNEPWRFLELEMHPVHSCFLRHKLFNVRILLKYGTPMTIPPEFNFEHFIALPNWIFHSAIERGIVTYRRAVLLFQVLYDFHHHRDAPHGLQSIWKSIKDPFISHVELFHSLIPVIPLETILQVHSYYATKVSGGNCSFNPTPRKLKQLCRFEVRKLLNSRHKLPRGIPQLNIPKILKVYLKEY